MPMIAVYNLHDDQRTIESLQRSGLRI